MAREKPTHQSLSTCAYDDLPYVPMLYANQEAKGHNNHSIPNIHIEMASLSFGPLLDPESSNPAEEPIDRYSPVGLLLDGAFSSGWTLALERAATLLGVNPEAFLKLVNETEEQGVDLFESDVIALLKSRALEVEQFLAKPRRERTGFMIDLIEGN